MFVYKSTVLSYLVSVIAHATTIMDRTTSTLLIKMKACAPLLVTIIATVLVLPQDPGCAPEDPCCLGANPECPDPSNPPPWGIPGRAWR